MGIFELKYSQETPPKVAINEAIELAKTFGGPSSGKFVNGVLGSIYKDMVNKGEIKEEEEQKISPKQETENIPQEVSAGGVVYNNEKEKNYIVLIKDGIGKWTFPKGHLNEGEDIKTAALREVSEETGLKKLKIKAELGQIEIIVNEPGKQPRPKIVHYFLMETKDKKVTREKNHPGVQDVGWFLLDDVEKILGYQNSKEIFNKALTILK